MQSMDKDIVFIVLEQFMKKCDKYHSLLTLSAISAHKCHESHYDQSDKCQYEISPSCKTGFHKRVKAFSFMGNLTFPGPRGPQEI